RLPDIDGFEVCKALRRNPSLPSLAIVQMSATFEAAEYKVRALEGGADTFLSDPVEPTVLVATVRAMLRLRHAEMQLREFDRRKDEFLATVAHELRNPLAPLRHCVEWLEQSPDAVSALQACLPIMRRQSDHLIRLVDDLADMSRITQNKLTLRLSSVDLLQTLEAAIDEHRAELEAKEQELDLDLPERPLILAADAVRLSQVFGNLLANGIRYTPRGGRISVAVRETGAHATVTFADTGEGIDPKDIDRIFDLFVQVAPHRTGLGIGLALVHRIVDMHGGSISASSPGRGAGSTFTVRLPLGAPEVVDDERRDAVQFRESLAPRATVPTPRRVLVVDDNVDVADSLAQLLKAMDHDVRVAYRGPDGVAAYSEFAPDVVLMDINMPGMDGLEAIAKIRAVTGGDRTLICTLSGHGKAHAQRAFEAGADGHLVKPIGRAELSAVLERA
ncbi:MAG TPA: response regulator, partial [Gammaproteobacteria bacterium]|nr:response regulator [Gammaproteobacteria bacterium]